MGAATGGFRLTDCCLLATDHSIMTKVLGRILQVAVTIAALWWVFRDPHMRESTWIAFRTTDVWWMILGIGIAGIGEYANALRWKIFLDVQKIETSLSRVTSLFMIGVFFNLLLIGATGGDVVRTAYLVNEQRAKKGAVILTVIADRLIGLLVMIPFTFIIVTVRYTWLSQTPIAKGLLWFLIIFMACSTLVMAAACVISRFRLVHRLPRTMPCRERVVRLAEACDLFGKARWEMLVCYALSFPVFFCVFGAFYCGARAYHANVSLLDMSSIMPVVIIVTSFPISFSGMGVREQLFQNLLGDLAHISGEIAVLISLAGFLMYVFWGLVGAVVYLFYKKPAATNPEPALQESSRRDG